MSRTPPRSARRWCSRSSWSRCRRRSASATRSTNQRTSTGRTGPATSRCGRRGRRRSTPATCPPASGPGRDRRPRRPTGVSRYVATASTRGVISTPTRHAACSPGTAGHSWTTSGESSATTPARRCGSRACCGSATGAIRSTSHTSGRRSSSSTTPLRSPPATAPAPSAAAPTTRPTATRFPSTGRGSRRRRWTGAWRRSGCDADAGSRGPRTDRCGGPSSTRCPWAPWSSTSARRPCLVGREARQPFTFAGWAAPLPLPSGEVDVLTPPTSVVALRNGFTPTLHPSAVT